MRDFIRKQADDVQKAIEKYTKSTQSPPKDKSLSAGDAAQKIVDRKNLLDTLDKELQNAGQTENQKRIWGK